MQPQQVMVSMMVKWVKMIPFTLYPTMISSPDAFHHTSIQIRKRKKLEEDFVVVEEKETALTSSYIESASLKAYLPQTKGIHLPESISLNDAYFLTQRFKIEWRGCLACASKDFEKQTKLFWTTVFDGVESASSDSFHGDMATNKKANMIDPGDIRGALPDTALRLYLTHISAFGSSNGGSGAAGGNSGVIQSLYNHLKSIHSTSLINSEALRKLVKKFDKEMSKLGVTRQTGGIDGNGAMRLSPQLLPEVYSSNFNVGLSTVEASLALVKQHLGLDDEDEDEDDELNLGDVHAARIKFMSMDGGHGVGLAGMMGMGGDIDDDDVGKPADDVAGFFGLSRKRYDNDAILVEKRKAELRWLRKLVESVNMADDIARANGDGYTTSLISCLVGHRGFHSITDKSDKRPIENSLMAYEAAWTNGIQLCECDIVLTADDKLILAHDENFVRLALELDNPLVHKNVRELTYKEIMSLPLKSGCRPPLLIDVLRSAHVIGGDARMIVEIKPGNVEAGTALAKMFARHPNLMERCAVVMSFDAYAMQNLKRELEVVFPSLEEDRNRIPRMASPPSTSRIGSPEYQDLATAGFGTLARGTVASAGNLSLQHQHRLGVTSTSGIIPIIPTAMSIGDVPSLVTPHPAVAASAADAAQLGMSLDPSHNDLGTLGPRIDSFDFSPFGQNGRVPSKHRMIGVSGATASTQLVTTLDTSQAMAVVVPKLLLITRNGPAQNKEQV
uniref:GP-PDE domain-containing protein n=1 Tax=Ditylum brightwellii TaxID=49249 RepID=A0A7S4RLM0_9STRA